MINYKLVRLYNKNPFIVGLPFLLTGQYIQCIYADFVFIAVCLSVFFALVAGVRKIPLILFMLLGALSVLPVSIYKVFVPHDGNSYLVKVLEEPRRKSVGAISLLLEIQNYRKAGDQMVVNGTGDKVFCKGKDLPWKNESRMEKGDLFFMRADFSPVQKSYNPFSFQQKLIRQGIHSTCRISYASKPQKQRSVLSNLREYLRFRVLKILGDNEKSGLFLSMTLGLQDTLSDESEKAFQKTGLAHLLVVSGYQISIVYISLFTLIISLARNLKILYLNVSLRKLSSVISIVFCTLYSFVVGMELSVIRALIAAIILLIGSLFEKKISNLNSLCLCMFILQLLYPMTIFEPGVELTFAALAGFLICSKDFDTFSGLKASLLASFFTSLISFFWFGHFSFLGLVLNPIFANFVSLLSCNFGFLAIILLLIGIDYNGVLIDGVACSLELFKELIVSIAEI